LAWVESVSPSVRARHHVADADDADRVLYGLEETRGRLEEVFPRIPEDMTVVLHGGPLGLAFTNPLLPVVWTVATPTSRRYIAGWVGEREMHVLAPRALEARASNAEGSRQMLALTPPSLYAKRVIHENNPALASVPRRISLQLRWAWLIEGGARWFAGQTDHARPAIARRLREGPPPRFPPGLNDAALLGQTVIDLLAQTHGERTVARFVCRFETGGPRDTLESVFGVRSLRKLERAWRHHLTRLTEETPQGRSPRTPPHKSKPRRVEPPHEP
jgi:hypothetical protein